MTSVDTGALRPCSSNCSPVGSPSTSLIRSSRSKNFQRKPPPRCPTGVSRNLGPLSLHRRPLVMQPPLRLTDAELDAVLAAARSLTVDRRDAFLMALAGALAGERELGPRVVYRAIRDVRRQFYDPPM